VTLRHWGQKSFEHTGSLLYYAIVQGQEEMKRRGSQGQWARGSVKTASSHHRIIVILRTVLV
jgi:hypothetical protein